MRALQNMERRLQGAVGNTFARLFGGTVQPAEVAAALQGEAQAHLQRQGGRSVAPNAYSVALGPTDREQFGGDRTQVESALSDMITEYLREQGWDTYGDVAVSLEESSTLHTGQFRISSSIDPDVDRRSHRSRAGVGQMSQQPDHGRPEPDADRSTPAGEPAQGQSPYGQPVDPSPYGRSPGAQPSGGQPNDQYGQDQYGQPYAQPYGQDQYAQGPYAQGPYGQGQYGQGQYGQGQGGQQYGAPQYGGQYGAQQYGDQQYGQQYGDQQYGQPYADPHRGGQQYGGQQYGQQPPAGQWGAPAAAGYDHSARPAAGAGYGAGHGDVQYRPEPEVTAVLALEDGSRRTYRLQRGSNVLGRAQDAAFRLPDTSVSRRHADVYFDGHTAVLHDLGSTNGTTVNGSSVQTWQLADGDVISLGHSAVRFSSRT